MSENKINNIFLSRDNERELQVFRSKGLPVTIIGNSVELVDGIKFYPIEAQIDANGNELNADGSIKLDRDTKELPDFNSVKAGEQTQLLIDEDK